MSEKSAAVIVSIPHSGNISNAKKRVALEISEDHRFFLAKPQTTHIIPIPRTGNNAGTGDFVGVTGTVAVTAGAGVSAVVYAVTRFTVGIVTLVPEFADSAWHWPL